MKMCITIVKEICKLTSVERKLLTSTLKIWKLGEMSTSSIAYKVQIVNWICTTKRLQIYATEINNFIRIS